MRKCKKCIDTASFEVVKNYVINNFGATTSIKSLTEALIKNGSKITRTTVSKYIQVLLDAKILYECNRFDMKSKKSLAGDKKYYLADFIFRSPEGDYSYMQVAYTIMLSKETEDREYKPLEQIRDNYTKYVATTDFTLQKRNGIHHINLIEHMRSCERF